MKILTISTPYQPTENVGSNGLGRHVYDYMTKMSEVGHDVTIVCHPKSNIQVKNVKTVHWNCEKKDTSQVYSNVIKNDYDVIVDNSHLKLLSKFYYYLDLPIVNFVHDFSCGHNPSNILLGNDFQLLKYPSGRVINTGIFFKNYKLYEEKEDYYCFCAKLEKRKGYDIAIALAQETGVNIKFAGPVGAEPVNTDMIPNWIGEIRGLKDFSEFVGKSKGLICPSRIDAGGLVLWEACALGTPCLSTISSGAQCNIVPGVTGYIGKDFNELCTQIKKLETLDPLTIRKTGQSKWDLDENYKYFEHALEETAKGVRW